MVMELTGREAWCAGRLYNVALSSRALAHPDCQSVVTVQGPRWARR